MTTEPGLFWLASYPKSGNTWFRLVLARLKNPSAPLDLNNIHTGAIASARGFVDETLGFDSALLTHDEIDCLRPAVYAWQGKEHTGYHKIHDAYTMTDSNSPMIPSEGCLGALYFVRNPLDVAISFANHSNCSIDDAITHLGNPNFAFCNNPRKQAPQLRQRLLSWSLHVQSWTTNVPVPLMVIRYEDLLNTPLPTFTKAFQFLRIDTSQAAIEAAIEETHINKLQDLEKQSGFQERPLNVKQFFRKGIVGDWKNTLTNAQMTRIIGDHEDVMARFGYLEKSI